MRASAGRRDGTVAAPSLSWSPARPAGRWPYPTAGGAAQERAEDPRAAAADGATRPDPADGEAAEEAEDYINGRAGEERRAGPVNAPALGGARPLAAARPAH